MNKNENGFSLLELSLSIAIMAIMTVIITPIAVNSALEATQKGSVRADLSAVMTEVQAWSMLNPNADLQRTEFNGILYSVLSEYVATPTLQSENLPYLNSFIATRIPSAGGDKLWWCVEATKPFGNKTITMYYDSLAGGVYDGNCPAEAGKPPVVNQ